MQAKNSEMLVECFYFLEDFVSLGRLMEALPEGNVLLRSIGEKFQSVGLCNDGVSAFLKVSGLVWFGESMKAERMGAWQHRGSILLLFKTSWTKAGGPLTGETLPTRTPGAPDPPSVRGRGRVRGGPPGQGPPACPGSIN